MVYQVARAMPGVPISGIGGIATAEDAVEFLLAGASTIQVGTQSFVDPNCAARVAKDLETFCAEEGVGSVVELVGALRV